MKMIEIARHQNKSQYKHVSSFQGLSLCVLYPAYTQILYGSIDHYA